MAQITHGSGNLQGAFFLLGWRRNEFKGGSFRDRKLHLKTLVATPA